MKTVGLIGGLTFESTAVYYRLLNEMVRTRAGGGHSAQLLIWSFDYVEALGLYLENKPGYKGAVSEAGLRLKRAGADALMICSNSAHMGAEQLAETTGLPVIHILDAVADELRARNVRRPLVLGTDFVMESDFYLPALRARVDVAPVIPGTADRERANAILFEELAFGNVRPESRQFYLNVIDKAEQNGADGVVLGCTEHCMILDQSHHRLPMLDSTRLHAQAAVDFQLADH